MNYTKTLGLLAIAAAALMAFAGTASATTLTSPAGTALGKGTKIKATSTSTIFDMAVSIACSGSTFEGEITNAGGGTPTQNVSGQISKLTFEGCNSHTITVLQGGTFSLESIGSGKGTLRWTGTEITLLTHSFFLGTWHCMYGFNNTHVGTVTGGSPATHSIDSAPLPIVATDNLCGNDMEWTGTYSFTQPNPLLVD